MATRKWVDWRGNNMTSAEVCRLIAQMCGSSYTVADLERTIRIGGMYRNGGIWFQRVA